MINQRLIEGMKKEEELKEVERSMEKKDIVGSKKDVRKVKLRMREWGI